MIPVTPPSLGLNSPPTRSTTDSDPDLIKQHHTRAQLTLRATEATTQHNQTSCLSDIELKPSASEGIKWTIPSYKPARSPSTPSPTNASPTLPHPQPQTHDSIPRLHLPSQFLNTKPLVPSPSSSSVLQPSTTVTTKPPPLLIPKPLLPIPIPTTVLATVIHPPSPTSPSPHFTPFPISTLESQFHIADPPLPIPSLIGLPLWMRYYSPPFCALASNIGVSNEAARLLFIESNGAAPRELKGAILVARRDGRDLLPEHVEALCKFCVYVFDSGGCGVDEMGGLSSKGAWKRDVEEEEEEEEEVGFGGLVRRRVFERLWEELREERGWGVCVGPYELGRLGRGGMRDGDEGGGKGRMVGKADTGRTEGLVTRGLARKREADVGSEDDDSRRRRSKESSEEASSEESDVLPPSKRRRMGLRAKLVMD